MDELAIACSLGPQERQRRLSTIRRLGEAALLDVEARPGGALLSFRDSDGVRDQLAAIVHAEAACCAFLGLTLGSGSRKADPHDLGTARRDAHRSRTHRELPGHSERVSSTTVEPTVRRGRGWCDGHPSSFPHAASDALNAAIDKPAVDRWSSATTVAIATRLVLEAVT